MSSDTETMSLACAVDASPILYLGTVQGVPLLWSDLGWDEHASGPYWPNGEPQRIVYEPDGSITLEHLCDVYQAWWPGLKRLDCGHAISAPAFYLTMLDNGRDLCLTCARGDRR